MTRTRRPCSGGCGATIISHLLLPMCHSCRRERNPAPRRTGPCAGCGKPVESLRRYEEEARCRDCSRKRRDSCPPCSTCGGKMSNTWFYKWIKGKAQMPPVCGPCQRAAK